MHTIISTLFILKYFYIYHNEIDFFSTYIIV